MDFLKSPAVFYSALSAFVLAVIFDLYMRTKAARKDEMLKMSSRMEKALAYFKEHKTRKRITNDIYQELAGVSHSTATRDLQKLEELGLLEQKGGGRGIYYRLIER